MLNLHAEVTWHPLSEGKAPVCMASHQSQALPLGRHGQFTLAYSTAETLYFISPGGLLL